MKLAALVVLLVAVLIGSTGTYYFKAYLPGTVARKSFPQVSGEIRIAGLRDRVDVYRDKMGIPHVYASTSHDLFLAQGYIHAQDRFWQMDFFRHVGEGRTAEMFGADQLETDTFLTTLGWKRTSQEEYEAMRPESKAILAAYADGVNSYIEGREKEELSLEYAILGLPLLNPTYKVERWEPVNTLSWARVLAWDLRSNIAEEIERATLGKTLTPERVAELFPPYPDDHPVIVNELDAVRPLRGSSRLRQPEISAGTLIALQRNASLLDSVLGPFSDGSGSNSWAVSGELTTTGKPLLANDPHLGIAMPSIWYQIGLHCTSKNADCPYDVAGFSLAGAPGIVIGHNDRIAWGFTFAYEDVMDLFIERVNPQNSNQYEVNGRWVDFEVRKHVINVAGGNPVEITTRASRHGPVISDVYGPLKNQDPSQVIALSWTAISTGNTLTKGNPLEAVWGLDRAENWDQFRKAASIFHTPGHNLLFADIDGNIAVQTPGDIPIRKNGDGTVPVPGWNGEHDWIGIVPFEELPFALNPPEGFIAPSNNKIIGDNYKHFISSDWDYGFRAKRIVELIEKARGKIDIAYFRMMQADAYDAGAQTYVPLIQRVGTAFKTSNERAALESLVKWNYEAAADSQAAAVYASFWRHLLKNTFDDELPESYRPTGGSRWLEVMRKIAENSAWWDNKTTKDRIETRNDILAKSFIDGVAELESLLGNDAALWKWGDLHVAVFRNATLGRSGISFVETLFNRGPFRTSGGTSIVNATRWNSRVGFEVTNLPSMRAVYDLSDFNNSVAIHTTGQSGHAYHPHYIDMAAMWANQEYQPMLWRKETIIGNSEGHLVLMP